MDKENKVVVSFNVEDVKTLFNLEDKQASTWLGTNRKYIEERLVELGWSVIETLGTNDGFQLAE